MGGINLGQGVCDLPTPDPIRARAHQALRDDASICQDLTDGRSRLRFCFAKESPVLRQACGQLREAFG